MEIQNISPATRALILQFDIVREAFFAKQTILQAGFSDMLADDGEDRISSKLDELAIALAAVPEPEIRELGQKIVDGYADDSFLPAEQSIGELAEAIAATLGEVWNVSDVSRSVVNLKPLRK